MLDRARGTAGTAVAAAVVASVIASPARTLGQASQRARDPSPAAIDSVFAQYDHTNTPGCAIGVYREGQIVYSRGYGMAELNQRIAITPQTVFYIGSTSKQFTAFAIALLAEQGRISLDDPVRKYVPELPAVADRVTIRQLIHHTSGLRDYLNLWGVSGRTFADEVPEELVLDLLAKQPALEFESGSRWAYSNSGYFLLAVILKRASGKTLREFAQTEMFEPLGMAHTHFHDDNTMIVPHRAEGYQPSANGGFQIVRTSYALVGDGGLLTTIDDMARWDANAFANRLGTGGQRLIELVRTPGRLNDGTRLEYGFGLFVGTYRGLPTIEHGGSFIGFRADLLQFPSERLSFAVLCNDYTATPDRLAQRLADLYLADRMEVAAGLQSSKVVTVSQPVLDRWVGRYELVPGWLATIRRDDDGLTLALGWSNPSKLTALADSVFVASGFPDTLMFGQKPNGTVTVMVKALRMTEPAPRLPAPPVLTTTKLAEYAGRYNSAELDTWFTFQVRKDTLRFRPRYGPSIWLEPILPDVFTGQGRMTFERDAKGRVTGFRWSTAGLTGIRFVRDSR